MQLPASRSAERARSKDSRSAANAGGSSTTASEYNDEHDYGARLEELPSSPKYADLLI
jgi:hypothetical protein